MSIGFARILHMKGYLELIRYQSITSSIFSGKLAGFRINSFTLQEFLILPAHLHYGIGENFYVAIHELILIQLKKDGTHASIPTELITGNSLLIIF